MAAIYDNWERLVRAVLRREELRLTGMRTPSDLSSASSSSFNFSSPSTRVSLINFPNSPFPGDSLTYQQILQATRNLSRSKLFFYGRSGDFYHGVLQSGIKVVVKEYDICWARAETFLMTELGFYAKVSHPRFVPLLGHCLEDGNHHKFLVYEYIPNGYLRGSMFSLDWKRRLKIAIGAAQGLFHLHHQCVPPLVHRNVGSSSILIDVNYDGCLGRLFEVCNENKGRNQTKISRLLQLTKGSEQGTYGPDETINATCAYDVYCFGQVLLDLITGSPGFSQDSIWTESGIETCLRCVTPHNKGLVSKIMDPNLAMDEHLLTEVWAVAVVAKACLNPKPSIRPQMKDVLKALEDPASVTIGQYRGARGF